MLLSVSMTELRCRCGSCTKTSESNWTSMILRDNKFPDIPTLMPYSNSQDFINYILSKSVYHQFRRRNLLHETIRVVMQKIKKKNKVF